MKKIALAVLVIATLFTSCSSNDNPDNPLPTETYILVKKTIDSDVSGSITSNYTYVGNKIVSIISTDGLSTVFTYTGNLITKVESFSGTNLDSRETFIYNSSGKLVTYLNLDYNSSTGDKSTYEYNTDGSISANHYTGDLSSQTTLENTALTQFVDGEVSREEEYFIGSTTPYFVVEYAYDNKENPYKNVLGFSKIDFVDHNLGGILHNVTSENYNGDVTPQITYSYTYNALNYPTQVTETSFGDNYTTQFFYE